MHLTTIKFIDGSEIQGIINLWRPAEGYLILLGSDEKLYFDTMLEALTEGERCGIVRAPNGEIHPLIQTVDELQRYRDDLKAN